MIRFRDFKLAGAPPLLSGGVRPPEARMAEGEVSVYGGFPVSAGIDNVAAALQAGFPDARVNVHDFGEELGPTLHFRAGPVFFSTLFMDEEDAFLFDGGVPGTLEEAIGFVQRLSECLAAAGLAHDFHLATGRQAADGTVEYAASFVYPPDAGE